MSSRWFHGGHFDPAEIDNFAFDPDLVDTGNYMGAGFYFSSVYEDAARYDYNEEYGEPSVMLVELAVKKPYILGKSPVIAPEYRSRENQTGEAFRLAVETAGYDAILDQEPALTFADEGYADNHNAQHIVVFDTDKIMVKGMATPVESLSEEYGLSHSPSMGM